MSLEALQLAAGQWPIKALVLTARLSNPLGVSMPDHRQKQLLSLAARFDIQIVEDDIYGELMFDQGQYKALKSNDRDGRVIYCSSFSKTLSPGVRIGWVIAGCHQAEIERLQTFSTHSACSVTQMGVAAYLENGGYDRHLRAIRQEACCVCKACVARIARDHLPDWPRGMDHVHRVNNARDGYSVAVSIPDLCCVEL